MDDLLTFRGTVLYQRYEQPTDDGVFRIVVVRPEGSGPDVVVKGLIPESDATNALEFTGKFEETKHGPTFNASGATRLRPVSLPGIAKFLTRWIDGIGETKATALVKHFGAEIFDVLDNHPGRLVECSGITRSLSEKIRNSWKEECDPDLLALRIWLAKAGIGSTWANRFMAVFREKTQEILEENPYRATAVSGIGFRKADEIAEKLGWSERTPQRTEAAVEFVIEEETSDGHCFLYKDTLVSGIRRVASSRQATKDETRWLPAAEAEAAIDRVIARGNGKYRKGLIEETLTVNGKSQTIYYLPRYHAAERRLAERIGELQSFLHATPRGLDESLARVVESMDQKPSDAQREAVVSALTNNLSVLTGGPGTGKSTTVNALLKTAVRLGLQVMLCAPTGRAAKRLSEITEREALTIHKLLRYDVVHDQFAMDRKHPLSCDLLVVDESSMLDIELADSLLDAVPDSCSVVFVGDIDQLPSVGPGMVLRDIIVSQRIHVTRLETIFRQAAGSLIIQNAHKIRTGQVPAFPEVKTGKGAEADSYFIEVPKIKDGPDQGKDDLEYIKNVLPRVMARLVDKHKIDPIKDVQVLMPMRKGPAGFPEFNKVLQPALNKHGREVVVKGQKFRIGDRVMQLANNYDLEIYNGDIGFIEEFDELNRQVLIDFYGRKIGYPYGEADNLVLSYAVTIHKSQGSEYDFVVVILTNHHYNMLERHLLYTANTRAKRLIVYIASWTAMRRAVEQDKVNRNTLLAHRIRKATAQPALPQAA